MKKTVITILCIAGLLGCATMNIPPYLPSFSYTPPSQSKTASAEVILAIVNPSYAVTNVYKWDSYDQFKTLPKSFSQDFHELLTAKGFTTRGPFNSFDEMTFPDKKDSDLILRPTIEIFTQRIDEKYQFNWVLAGNDVTGKIVVKARINLEVRESLTNELMWSKSLDAPTFEIPYKVHLESPEARITDDRQVVDNRILNEIVKGIEKTYSSILGMAWKHLDPEEMRLVKKQAQEIKSKKGY